MTAHPSPELPGIDPAPPAAAQHVHLALQGTLAEDARSWVAEHGQVFLQVVLAQYLPHHPHAAPIVATLEVQHASQLQAIDAGRQRAGALRRGMAVQVVGLCLQPGQRHGKAVIKLLHTYLIQPADLQPGPALAVPDHLRAAPACSPIPATSSTHHHQEAPRHAH